MIHMAMLNLDNGTLNRTHGLSEEQYSVSNGGVDFEMRKYSLPILYPENLAMQ
jgi:hypothetical protein